MLGLFYKITNFLPRAKKLFRAHEKNVMFIRKSRQSSKHDPVVIPPTVSHTPPAPHILLSKELDAERRNTIMQIDRKMLDKLLTMNDEQLRTVIETIATEAGIDPRVLGLDPRNIQSIRSALGSTTDSDLGQINAIYNSYKQNKRGH
jgi:hypothetical protein